MTQTNYTDGISRGRDTVVPHDQFQAVVKDRIRWGPVIVGVFAAMAALSVLAVLGIAIGFSSADYGDSPSAFGIGAGIWTFISVLIAFFLGGMLAAYTAATPATDVDERGRLHNDNGLLQGAAVWIVAIPLSIYLVAGGIGSALGMAGNSANAAVQAGSNVAGPMTSNNSTAQDLTGANGSMAADQARSDVSETTQRAADQVAQAGQNIREAVTPERVERAARIGAGTAWATLASMLIGLGAASAGGYFGGKSRSITASAM